MNSRSLIIGLVAGLALALLMFGVTVLIGNSQGWFETTTVVQNVAR